MGHYSTKQGCTRNLTIDRQVVKGLAILALIYFFTLNPYLSNFASARDGSSYYVSPNGDDGNPGSITHPWRTLLHAGQQILAGDTLYIRRGTYSEHFYITNSGTESNPIKVTNYNGEEVIVDGDNMTIPPHDSGTPLIGVQGDWIIVSNLIVSNSGQDGVSVEGRYDVLDNLRVHHNWGGGVVLKGDYALIQNSSVWSNAIDNEGGILPSSWGAGIYCARYPEHCTIRKNIVWGNWGEGINAGETLHAVIEDNILYDNMQNFYIHDTKYALVQRNISYYTAGNPMDSITTTNCFLVGDEQGGVPIPLGPGGVRYPSSDNIFINNLSFGGNHNLEVGTSQSDNNLFAYNTFGNSSGDTSEPVNILFNPGSCNNCRFINNIVTQDDGRAIISVEGSGIIFANNLWSKTPPISAVGDGDIIGDPLFSKAGDPYSPGWYELNDQSAAIDSAIPLSEVVLDFFSDVRGSIPDIGANENNPLIFDYQLFLPAIIKSGQ